MSEQVKNYAALMAEVEKQAFRFELDGREWTIRHITDADYRLARDGAVTGDLEAIDKILRKGMGRQQYVDWEDADVPMRVLNAIFEDYLEHCGLSSGKSESSTSSSETTEKPSRPASRRTTRASASGTSTKARSRRASSSST